MCMTDISAGDIVLYEPENDVFPTGEERRSAIVEAVRSEIIIRQIDDRFTNRIKEDQVVFVFSDGAD